MTDIQRPVYPTPDSLSLEPILTCRRDDPGVVEEGDNAIGEPQKLSTVRDCCLEGACESCNCCRAGWCVAGTDGPPSGGSDPDAFEHFYFWIDAHDTEVKEALHRRLTQVLGEGWEDKTESKYLIAKELGYV